ncbi:MAG: hypothetical protein A2Y59_05910 [Chloroflexi bacterium RBG_13_52_14]|nr:MAG: hypothetical protein A2Y59_05910 [Chloroflexi bacterium RBG_13_52_14]
MTEDSRNSNAVTSAGDSEAVQHLKQAIAGGRPWHIALLEAIGLWSWPEESHDGQYYRYLVAGEAFDWLLLAERLCKEVDGLIPEAELSALLFFGKLPEEVSQEDFKRLIGSSKYHAYLNYFYGIIVEQAIILAVEEEICKENHTQVFSKNEKGFFDSYYRVYGASQETLFHWFMQDKGYPESDNISLAQWQEFTYWMFRFRLANCDKARVASDTKKGLEYLNRQRIARGLKSL